jgi:REP element-mobilizing transposase RayT
MPVHVTLRIGDAIPSLRSSRRYAAVRRCLEKSRGRFGVRLAEFSVLSNHLHLLVEADDSRSLARAIQGLCVRLARAVNLLLGRRGAVFSDHYHSRVLRTPTELCRAIRYVLENAGRHYGESGADPMSSAVADVRDLLLRPLGWLLRAGWRRAKNPIQPTISRY